MRQSIKTQAEALTGNFADMRTFRLRDRLRQALRLWTPSDQGNFVGLLSSLSAENVSSIGDLTFIASLSVTKSGGSGG